MRIVQRLIFSLALMTVLFAGCETTNEAQQVDKPTVRMVGLRLQDVKLDYATLLFDVEIDNPYPASLPLASLNYSLTSGSNTFLTATPVQQTAVPPNSKETVTLLDKVIYARLLGALDSEPGSTIPYEVRLWLWVDTPNLGLIELQSANEGQLALPNPPEIEVQGKIYHAVDVVFISTPHDVVDKMLELAEVKQKDLLYDLGCGEKCGCKAVGYDIDPQRVKESLENVQNNKVADLVTIEEKDIFTLDLSSADVITLYLNPSLNVKLIPQLEKVRPGCRIVSHSFDIDGVKPDKVATLTSKEDGNKHTVYLWVAPLRTDKRMGDSLRSSLFRRSPDMTAPRFAARKPPQSRVCQLGWTVWPLYADI
jgi:LEA14-like dessication related protein